MLGVPFSPSPVHCFPVLRPRQLGRSPRIYLKMAVQVALVFASSFQLWVPCGASRVMGGSGGGHGGAEVSAE